MTRAVEVVRKLATAARAEYVQAFEQGDALLRQHDITTPKRLSHFLAQCLHESDAFQVTFEALTYRTFDRLKLIFGAGNHSAALTDDEVRDLLGQPERLGERVYGLGNPRKAAELGNTRPGDGFKYRGGGILQTTGRENYRRIGRKCQVDFETDPKLIVSAAHALKPALAEWTEQGLNAFADNDDVQAISRAINLGGPYRKGRVNGIEDRVRWLAKVQPWISQVDFDTAAGSPDPVRRAPTLPPPNPADPVVRVAPLVGNNLLRMGHQGPVVRAVQLALARLGYGLRGTGYFGGATETSVTDFQERSKIEVDGIVGPETANAIDRAIAALPAAAATAHPGAGAPAASLGAGDRPLWLIEGLRWLGTEETQGVADNPQILDWARDERGDIARVFNHDSIPWCALFANMVLTKVGIKGTETLWALDWAGWGKALAGPAVGAFAPMERRDQNGNRAGHIAIVVGRDQHGNLMCLGGNQDDAVNIKPFPAARPLGFRWPGEVPPPAGTGLASLPLVRSDGRTSQQEG
jgi:uncharacterized protein (TIGR02594 family)